MNGTPDKPADVQQPVCNYCGLPVPGIKLSQWDSSLATGSIGPLYCCLGCRFAAAVTSSSGEVGKTRWLLTRLGFAGFFTMSVMVFSMQLWTVDIYENPAGATKNMADVWQDLLRYLSLIFALPVFGLLGGSVLDSAIDSVRR